MISIHSGIQALRNFKVKTLQEKLQSKLPNLSLLCTEYIHFIESDIKLNSEDKAHLDKLLNYAPSINISNSIDNIIVTPRHGTISPWSSKATDIVHLCGLKQIKRLERGINYHFNRHLKDEELDIALNIIMDRMTESYLNNIKDADFLFSELKPKEYQNIDVLLLGKSAIEKANIELGLALSDGEIEYLYDQFSALGRNPTDIELMMFAQVNSEHCRHKIFNADWIIDEEVQTISLFGMIKNTYQQNPQGLLSVYSDNSAVMTGYESTYLEPNEEGIYSLKSAHKAVLMKVETHNHPTAIAPHPGAATGSGGEIRDEGATGRGSKP